MAKSKYTIQYLPSFDRELTEILYYITFVLENKSAAERLLNNIKIEIEKRSQNPKSYEIYKGKKKTKYDWYRIYINNYTIFYTVKDSIMEIAHLIYCRRKLDNIL